MSEMSVRIVTPSTPVLASSPSTVELARILDPYQEQSTQNTTLLSSPKSQAASLSANTSATTDGANTQKNGAKVPHLVVRKARISDLPAIADLLAQAFWDEDAVGRFMHPYKDKHPRDYMRYWRRRAARGMCDWHREMLVATLTDDKEKILGVVEWSDNSGKDLKKDAKWLFQIPLAMLSTLIEGIHRPNRAAKYSRLHAYFLAYPRYIKPLVVGTPKRASCIALDLLAVDPAHQGIGIGRSLVSAGLKRAKRLNRGVSVICADGKETFYERCGFEELVGKITDGEDNPLKGVRGGEVRFWWPQNGEKAR